MTTKIKVVQKTAGGLYTAVFANFSSEEYERKEDAFQEMLGQAVRGGYWEVTADRELDTLWTDKLVRKDTFEFVQEYEGEEIPPKRSIKKFIIDVETRSLKNILRRVKQLKSTVSAEDGGVYWEDPSYAKIRLESTKTEREIDEWLYSLTGKNTNYVGVTEVKEKTND